MMLSGVLRNFMRTVPIARCYGTSVVGTSKGQKNSHNCAIENVTATMIGLKPPGSGNSRIERKIDPIVQPFVYKMPSIKTNLDNLIFGIPIAIMPDVSEPERIANTPVKDPESVRKPKIEAHKRDKYWRRRGMKHHRYSRWRKRNETMLAHREAAKMEKKMIRLKLELRSIWEDAGLQKEPPKLSDEEKKALTMKWKKEGIWTDPLTPEELYNIVTPPEPRNKKVFPPNKKHNIIPK